VLLAFTAILVNLLGQIKFVPTCLAAIAPENNVVNGNAQDIRERKFLAAGGFANAYQREEAARTREEDMHTADITEGTPDDQINMLRQVNSNLVIAALEAQRLAEEIEAAKVRLDHLAHHDILTDLPNRTLLHDRIVQAIELAHRQSKKMALLFMDLDRFKYINDSLGHAIGDQLLKVVARCLMNCVRQSDTVSRLGGDEFILLLPIIEHAEDAALAAEKILTTLEKPHHVDGHDLHISASIGISIYPDDGHDAETLIKSADTAMYCAKESGRNNYNFFEQDMNARAVERHAIEVSLRRAMEQQEFVLYFQPKINLHSGKMVGVEALIRWNHPERGLLLPSQFIPIAEECGLILPIGRWVLRTACLQAQIWRQAGFRPIVIAVNTSALEFRAKDFIDNISATLQETGMDASCLELELTESVLMRDAESTDTVLHALADLGVRLAVDDFGTGYSSLSYLRRFPIHTLKIDQSFVTHMSSNQDDATIVNAIISVGKSLKKCVIAEGVETPEQLNLLLDQHCDEGQGYFWGRPVAAEDLAIFL
jgi:diguanylate cyclase (GGDEF)-like protein